MIIDHFDIAALSIIILAHHYCHVQVFLLRSCSHARIAISGFKISNFATSSSRDGFFIELYSSLLLPFYTSE